MERIVNIAASYEEARDWDIRQQLAMTPQERILAVRAMQKRVYSPHPKDVREWHKNGQTPPASQPTYFRFGLGIEHVIASDTDPDFDTDADENSSRAYAGTTRETNHGRPHPHRNTPRAFRR